MEDFGIGERLRALRLMRGYASVPALANALEQRGTGQGLGQTNLYLIERGEKVPDFRDMQEIADLCDVPVAWFTADFSRLGEISEDPRATLARAANGIAARIEARRATQPASRRDPQQGRQ